MWASIARPIILVGQVRAPASSYLPSIVPRCIILKGQKVQIKSFGKINSVKLGVDSRPLPRVGFWCNDPPTNFEVKTKSEMWRASHLPRVRLDQQEKCSRGLEIFFNEMTRGLSTFWQFECLETVGLQLPNGTTTQDD